MDHEIEEYGDANINSYDKKIPGWLKLVYYTLPLWGIFWFYMYWNGSHGWLDRGHWGALQKAANTTFTKKKL